MVKRIIEIDDLIRRDHHYLTPEDKCYFHGEYTAGEGYAYSHTNHLVINFKKEVNRRGRMEWQYKERAIAKAAQILASAFTPEAFSKVTFVPVPPSKAKTDPLYDDRLVQMLKTMCQAKKSDIRELVIQVKSMDPSHASGDRPTPDQIAANYILDQSLLLPTPNLIFICDDVITTGSHFKAVQKIIRTQFPETSVCGLFIARRVPKSVDFDFEILGESD